MHDLRRQALESGKTTSRRARSKVPSPANSKPNSPATSRAASRVRGTSSRAGSDDEDELSDETSFRQECPLFVCRLPGRGCAPLAVLYRNASANNMYSVGSIDEVLNGDSTEQSGDAWRPELADRIEEILARKGSTVLGREKCYKTYIHILTSQYAEEEIRGKEAELVVAFLKSIKEEKTEKETILAMKGTAIIYL